MKTSLHTLSEPLPGNFRIFLAQELSQRMRTNPSYSLRAFARDLDVDPSHLSKVLRGIKPVTLPFLEESAHRMELAPEITHRFRHFHSEGQTGSIENAAEYSQVSQDTFEIIANWQNYAVLELMKVVGFRPDLSWIAHQLDISRQEAYDCADRLQRTGLLQILSDGTWIDVSSGFSTHVLGPNYTSVAHRKAQREILSLAIEALDETPIEQRDQSSMMMATSYEKLLKAKEMIRDFRRQLTTFLEEGESKDAVFQLSVSLFPLTEPKLKMSNETIGEIK